VKDQLFSAKEMLKRIAFMDSTGERRKSMTGELMASLTTLGEIIGHDEALMAVSAPKMFSPQLDLSMRQIHECGMRGVNWSTNIEEQLLSNLDDAGKSPSGRPGGNHPGAGSSVVGESSHFSSSSSSSVSNGGIGEISSSSSSTVSKLEKLRKQAEVALALFVSSQSSDERKNALDAIDDLLKIIQTDIEVAQIRNTPNLKDLVELKSYVLQGKAHQLQDAGTIVSERDIQIFEESLFSFLDRLSKLDQMPKHQHDFAEAYMLAISPSHSTNSSSASPSGPPMSRADLASSLLLDSDSLRSALVL
jgi:hypothetical protein